MSLASDLRKAMESRDLKTGYALLSANMKSVKTVELRRNGYELVFEISRWLSMRPEFASKVLRELARINTTLLAKLSFASFVHLKLAESFAALRDHESEQPDVAEKAAREVIALQDSIPPKLAGSAYFCLGRALMLQNKPDEALECMQSASRIFSAQEEGVRLAGVVDLQIHQLYLRLPERFSFLDAQRVLDQADTRLGETGDILNRAFIKYLRGRTWRFRGDYRKADKSFQEARDLYELEATQVFKGPQHRMVVQAMEGRARTLREWAASPEPGSLGHQQDCRDLSRSLLSKAHELAIKLDASILTRTKIGINQGYLALDELRIAEANARAKYAMDQCSGHGDPLILSRIHLLRFKIAFESIKDDSASVEEIEEATKDANKALTYAERTTHRRIKARAYIANGELVLYSLPGPAGRAKADEYLTKANELLLKEDNDYLRVELDQLRAKLASTPAPIKIVLSIPDLFEQNLMDVIERKVKSVIVKRTQHLYRSARHMKETTGLSLQTIKHYAAEGKWGQDG